MPEGRCRRPHRKHESIFILANSEEHNFRIVPPVSSVWDLKPDPVQDKKHTSTFPLSLPLTCIDSTGLRDGIVLDPFMGSGTTAVAALTVGLQYIGFEADPVSTQVANERAQSVPRYLPMTL
jgi:DNA modification methylase